MGFFDNVPRATRNLLMVNALCWIICELDKTGFLTRYCALWPVGSGLFYPWQLVTYMFMHGGFAHLFFNMFALVMFGSVLERVWGENKYTIFYFACGLGAALANVLVLRLTGHIAPTVGASGAVYGLLLGYAMLYPDSTITLLFPPITLPARTMVLVYAGIELLLGIFATRDGIAHFAHLGGMLVAFIIILWWKKRGRMYSHE